MPSIQQSRRKKRQEQYKTKSKSLQDLTSLDDDGPQSKIRRVDSTSKLRTVYSDIGGSLENIDEIPFFSTPVLSRSGGRPSKKRGGPGRPSSAHRSDITNSASTLDSLPLADPLTISDTVLDSDSFHSTPLSTSNFISPTARPVSDSASEYGPVHDISTPKSSGIIPSRKRQNIIARPVSPIDNPNISSLLSPASVIANSFAVTSLIDNNTEAILTPGHENTQVCFLDKVGHKNLRFSLPNFASITPAQINYPIPPIVDIFSHMAYTIFTESAVDRGELQEIINAHAHPETNGLKHLSGQCIDLYVMWLKIILEEILPAPQRVRIAVVKTSYAMNRAINVFALNPQLYESAEGHVYGDPQNSDFIVILYGSIPFADGVINYERSNGHFSAAIYEIENKSVLFFDSLTLENEVTVRNDISQVLRTIIPQNSTRQFDISDFIYCRGSFFNRQSDGFSCGFFACFHIEMYFFWCRKYGLETMHLPNFSADLYTAKVLNVVQRLSQHRFVPFYGFNPVHFTANISDIFIVEAIPYHSTTSSVIHQFDSIPLPHIITNERETPMLLSPVISTSSSHLSSFSREHTPIRLRNRSDTPISAHSMQLRTRNRSATPIRSTFNRQPALSPIVRRCYRKHVGIPCADVRARHTDKYFHIGEIGDAVCEFCGAMLYKFEVNEEYFKKHKIITSSFCCKCGTVSLPPYKNHPQLLKNLSKGETPESKEFLAHANIYNSLLSFASISVGHKENTIHGDVCFLLNGEFTRQIGSISAGQQNPSFAQLYILDPTSANDLRTNNTRYGGDRVNQQTLADLDRLLRAENPLAHQFRTFHQQYIDRINSAGPDSVKNFRLTLLEARDAPISVLDRTLHSRQVNMPEERTLFSIWTETDEAPQLKGIWVSTIAGDLREFQPHHPMTDSLCYTLMFPLCDDGFHKQIPVKSRFSFSHHTRDESESLCDSDSDSLISVDSDSCESGDTSSVSNLSVDDYGDEPTRKKKYITIRDYIRYRMALRKEDDFHNIWQSGGGLCQKFVLDYSARIDSEVANSLRRPELDLRSTLPDNVLRWLAHSAQVDSVDKLGSIVLFRKNHPGTRPYFQDMFYDATTIMSRTRKPGCASFMFTFTTNPYWPEIIKSYFAKLRNRKFVNLFDITCRVFEGKLRWLHHLLDKKNIFGKISGGAESREFQKRAGGPHIHRVFCTDILSIPENIQNLIWAHIPPPPGPNEDPAWAWFITKIRELIAKHQLHDCGSHCRTNRGTCKKGFPKPFSKHTILYDDRPAQYYRPHPDDDGQTLVVKRGNLPFIYDNSHVVPYNPFILVHFETHHNLEFAYGQSTNLKYALKYPFKGASFSYVKSAEDGRTNIDEPAQYSKMLYRSPAEAYSRIMSYKYAYLSHVVHALEIHLPGQQRVVFGPSNAHQVFENVQQGILPVTPLSAYWDQCRTDHVLRKILFEHVPETYTFDRKLKIWKKREISKDPKKAAKRKPIIGRILPVSPREIERFALYILTKHFPGHHNYFKHVPTDTDPNHYCTTFAEAARLRGLLEDNEVWEKTLREGSNSLTPSQMRQLFVGILVFGSTQNCIIDGLHLWNMFCGHMYDTRCNSVESERRKDRALALIERLLMSHGRLLADFQLPLPINPLVNDPDRAVNEFFFPTHVNDDEPDETIDHSSMFGHVTLNSGQREFYDQIMNAAMDSFANDRLFFLSGDGGTGKTFLLNFLLYMLRQFGKKVLPTASTGVASTKFYAGGMTLHSAFKMGINNQPGKLPSIPLESYFGRRITECDLLFLDEVTMLDRVVFENADSICRRMRPQYKNIPFGNMVVVISGDWKQSLPVVLNATCPEEQLAASIQSSPLYPLFKKFRLTENMRLNSDEITFKEWLYKIGTDQSGEKVAIPANMIVESRDELRNFVFEKNVNLSDTEILSRLCLSPTNLYVDIMNADILNSMNTFEQNYFSVDKSLNENPTAINAAEHDVTHLNLLTPLGMPAHHIRLKIGAIIVLLANYNTQKGLCNGTRLIVRKLSPYLIVAETISSLSRNRGVTVALSRITSTHINDSPDEPSFERSQFPVRLAYAMTITKAQGQTCEKVGIDFTDEPFAHGQLYTSMSRATSGEGVRIFAPNKEKDANGNVLIRNVVAKGLKFD